MDSELFQKLEALEFDLPGTELTFSRRLARENGWPNDFTDRVLKEYRRFLYLCAKAGHPVTPSDAVDQAWHLHLCYTESYWHELCRDILGFPLHHGPTKGGKAEGEKFHDWYSKTLESYCDAFGEDPSRDIWPEPEMRFQSVRFQRVDRDANFVVPKWLLTRPAIITTASLLLIGCGIKITDNSDVDAMIVLGVVLLLLILLCLKHGGGGGKAGGSSSGCGGGCGGCGNSGCGGGCGGCGS